MLPKKIIDLFNKVDYLLDQVVAVLNRVNEMIDLMKMAQAAQSAANAPLSGEQLAAHLDWDSYTVGEIADRVPSLSPEQRQAMLKYEKENKNRVGVVRALEEVDAAS